MMEEYGSFTRMPKPSYMRAAHGVQRRRRTQTRQSLSLVALELDQDLALSWS